MAGTLDLDQLRTFVEIAETGSFTRAATRVHKTQSAVSMQMRRLEDRLGRKLFVRDGRMSKLSGDGERLLDYARRLVKLNQETLTAFDDAELTGRVCLGTADDYADRFLPEILARFARSNPLVEVTVVCAPTFHLVDSLRAGELDLAIITHVDKPEHFSADVVRREPLLWVSSARHGTHEEDPLPLALGRPNCDWRAAGIAQLDTIGRRYRILYSSWNSSAVGATVLAGLAVSVLPESALRPGMRILTEEDGFPTLPSCEIALMRSWTHQTSLIDALQAHVVTSLDNLSMQNAAE